MHYESDQPLTSSPKLPPGSKRKHLNLNHNPLCDPRITNAVKALDELSGQEEQESKKRTANVHDATNSGEKIPAVMDPNEMECESEIEEDDDRVDRTMMDDFKDYCEFASHNYRKLPPHIAAGIELMKLLGDRGVPLKVYDEIFQWHLRHMKAKTYIAQDKLLGRLRKRYNQEDTLAYQKDCHLPAEDVKVKITCHDAESQIRSLLSDPRVKEEDYLFFNDDPMQGPPEEFLKVSDINTGLAYRETYQKLIQNDPYTADGRRKILLPVIFYMDGCVMGQFDKLPLEALKMTLGIFNSKARDKDYMWREIGYVTKYLKSKSDGLEFIKNSDHIDSQIYLSDDSDDDSLPPLHPTGDDSEDEWDEEEDDECAETILETESESEEESDCDELLGTAKPVAGVTEEKAQDLHCQLGTMLEGYEEVQDKGGLPWDQPYKGTVHKFQYIPFILICKGDTVEHDKHCGSYNSRTKGVKQLCRYCCCPTSETGDVYRKNSPRKTQTMIEELVNRGDKDALKNMSQQYIQNCWYKFRFGMHNDYGIHGAAPLEVLHWICLGKYKYIRGMFFFQTGKESLLSKRMDACAAEMGFLLQRQSDKNLPRTKFTTGVKKGKLMGHEMSGMILVLLAVCRSHRGRNMLLNESRGQQKKFFQREDFVTDWIMLLETLLEFEAWLRKPELDVALVKRARTKIRELLSMEKNIGKREAGMGFNIFNFHAGIHVPDDILFFGVPSNVNTMANESHHRPNKKASKRTQRRPKLFDMQCANRIHDMNVINLGMEELAGRPVWDYYKGFDQSTLTSSLTTKQSTKPRTQQELSGTRVEFSYDPSTETWTYKVISKMRRKNRFKFTADVESFLVELMETNAGRDDVVDVYTEYTSPDGDTYRASPFYLGKPWLDWAIIDFEGRKEGKKPGQMQCFIDFGCLPENNGQLGEGRVDPGIYTIVEIAKPSDDPEELTKGDLFRPFVKERLIRGDEDDYEEGEEYEWGKRLLSVKTDSILGPTVLIPDLENPNPCAYLRLLSKDTWANKFEVWLKDKHTREFLEPQE